MRYNPETGFKLIASSLFGILVGVLIFLFILKSNDTMVDYEILTIEGMVCIEYNNSLTCNWDEWKGDPK